MTHAFLSQIRDYFNLEGQIPVFMSPGYEIGSATSNEVVVEWFVYNKYSHKAIYESQRHDGIAIMTCIVLSFRMLIPSSLLEGPGSFPRQSMWGIYAVQPLHTASGFFNNFYFPLLIISLVQNFLAYYLRLVQQAH
jgi:hypothetical protein